MKRILENKISTIGVYPYDILLVGGTGVGKSSTLNAMFGKTVTRVGYGVDPETQRMRKVEINKYLRIWDTPGLGDGADEDRRHKNRIKSMMKKRCHEGDKMPLPDQIPAVHGRTSGAQGIAGVLGSLFSVYDTDSRSAVNRASSPLYESLGFSIQNLYNNKKSYCENERNYGFIDMAVVILDAAPRDLGTAIDLLDLLSNWLGQDRILVFMNRCDMAMSPRHWITEKNCPDSILEEHLEQQREDLRQRIKLNTGFDLKPIYYSALHKYHVGKVLNRIMIGLPEERRKME